jgi:hypothetical protein
VTVRTIAITAHNVLASSLAAAGPRDQHTNKGQPDELKLDNGHDCQPNPQEWLHIKRHPEEPAVCGIDGLGRWITALEYPFGIARLRINLVPPAEADQATSSNVLEVVEIGCQEQDDDYKEEDADSDLLADCDTMIRLRCPEGG